MAVKSLVADGLKLDSLAQWVGVDSNRWSVPGAKGENVEVPGRHGALYVPDKTFSEGEFSLEVVVFGATDDGLVPANELAQVRTNIDRLLRIFTKRKDLIRFEQELDDGTVIECYAECIGAFDVTRRSGALPFARFKAGLKVPGAFWQDASVRQWSSPAGLTTNQLLTMPPFEGGTAPMGDLVFLFHGPASDPEITVDATGAYVRLERSLADGETWRIDAAKWSSSVGDTANVTFSGGGTSAISDTVHGGSRTFVNIPPLDTFDVAIEVGGTNLGAATQIEAQGRRKHMIG